MSWTVRRGTRSQSAGNRACGYPAEARPPIQSIGFNRRHTFTQQLDYSGQFGPLTLLAGAFYYNDRFKSVTSADTGGMNNPTLSNLDFKTKAWGVYVDETYNINDKLFLDRGYPLQLRPQEAVQHPMGQHRRAGRRGQYLSVRVAWQHGLLHARPHCFRVNREPRPLHGIQLTCDLRPSTSM